MSFGDVGPGSGTDVSYTGDTGQSVLSVQYYRDKALQFQDILNQVDATARAAQTAIDANIDSDLTNDLLAQLREFDFKKGLFRATAEGINAGAAVINSLGGRFPELSVPAGLGLVPLVIPAATIAAIAVAASLVVWGSQWVSGVNERMKLTLLTGSVSDPVKRDALLSSMAMTEATAAAASGSPLSSIAGVVKWGAIALAAWLAYQAFAGTRRA
jgi:hypothetical protein